MGMEILPSWECRYSHHGNADTPIMGMEIFPSWAWRYSHHGNGDTPIMGMEILPSWEWRYSHHGNVSPRAIRVCLLTHSESKWVTSPDPEWVHSPNPEWGSSPNPNGAFTLSESTLGFARNANGAPRPIRREPLI